MAKRIGFIGAGNMAAALIGGIVRSGLEPPSQVIASDVSAERLEFVRDKYGIAVAESNIDLLKESEFVILAIKPQQFRDVTGELDQLFHRGQTLVSIMAGVRIDALRGAIGRSAPIIRVMPNLPALVGAGMSALALSPGVTEREAQRAEQILGTVGETVRVPEDLMDAVTALSGSGPGFIFALVEAFIKAGEEIGLEPETATLLARQTFFGSVRLMIESGDGAAELRQRVTSKGGTTEAGLKALAEAGLEDVIRKGITAARDRSVELGKG